MPIYVGGNEVNPNQIYVGGTPVQAVYVGSTQVWPVGSVLPAGQMIGIQNGNALGTQSGDVVGTQAQPLILPDGNLIGIQNGNVLGAQIANAIIGLQDQAEPSSGAHDHFNAFGPGQDPGHIIHESLRTNQSITDSALSPSNVFDYWSVNNTIEAAEARCGPEFTSRWPHVLTAGYLQWSWTPVSYVTDPGTWVSHQMEFRYSPAFGVDKDTYLGGGNLTQKIWNIRNGSNTNINGLKSRINSLNQYTVEKLHELYYRTHLLIADYLRAGETVNTQQEPLAGVSSNYPGWVGTSRRNNQYGLPETLAIDQDRSSYTAANVWTGSNTPAWVFVDKWIQVTVHHWYGGATDQRLRIDVATEDFGPLRMFESEVTPGLGANRYTDPQEPGSYASGAMVAEWDSSQKGTGITLDMAGWAALDLGDGIDYSRGVRIDCRNVIVRKGATPLPTVRPIRVEP